MLLQQCQHSHKLGPNWASGLQPVSKDSPNPRCRCKIRPTAPLESYDVVGGSAGGVGWIPGVETTAGQTTSCSAIEATPRPQPQPGGKWKPETMGGLPWFLPWNMRFFLQKKSFKQSNDSLATIHVLMMIWLWFWVTVMNNQCYGLSIIFISTQSQSIIMVYHMHDLHWLKGARQT